MTIFTKFILIKCKIMLIVNKITSKNVGDTKKFYEYQRSGANKKTNSHAMRGCLLSKLQMVERCIMHCKR